MSNIGMPPELTPPPWKMVDEDAEMAVEDFYRAVQFLAPKDPEAVTHCIVQATNWMRYHTERELEKARDTV